MRIISYNQYLFLSLLISLIGVIGSLYVSEVMKIPPCDLCWFQRIFMYSLPIISTISLLRGDKNIRVYLQSFSVIGFGISVYQYIIQKTEKTSPFCSLEEDCTTIHFEFLGFITLPFLAALAFLIIFLLGFAVIEDKKEKDRLEMN